MKTLRVVLCACMALSVVASGCGDDNDNSASAPETQQQPAAPSTAEEETTGAGGESAEVSIKDFTFKPASVTVPKGETVIWTNDDSVGHDVTKTGGPGPAFNSGDAAGMAKGDAFDQTFQAAGTVSYVCRAHVGMEGTVTIQ